MDKSGGKARNGVVQIFRVAVPAVFTGQGKGPHQAVKMLRDRKKIRDIVVDANQADQRSVLLDKVRRGDKLLSARLSGR